MQDMMSDDLVEALAGRKLCQESGLDVPGETYVGHFNAVRIFFDTTYRP